MKNTVLLCLMMFVQFIMLPVWFVPMLPYVQAMPGGGDWALWCGLIMGFGTFTSPIVGMFADRFFNAERVLAACDLAGGLVLSAAFFVRSPAVLFVLMLAAMCFYMPTWSLTAAIAMANARKEVFARIRVFGTIGWVSSAVFSVIGAKWFGIDNFDSTPWIFAGGAAMSAVGVIVALCVPKTPPCAKGQPLSVADALGLRALVLFKNREFLFFAALILLAMIPFQWYNVYCAAYLKESGFRYLTLTLNLGQAGEILFMLLVPVIVKKFGYKWALVIALSALAFRNASFACSSAFGWAACDFGGILVHGLIFGLLIVGSQMYIDEVAPKELRNQAQGLMNLLTAGVGVFLSNGIFETVLKRGAAEGACNWTTAYIVAFAVAAFGALVTACCFKTRPVHD